MMCTHHAICWDQSSPRDNTRLVRVCCSTSRCAAPGIPGDFSTNRWLACFIFKILIGFHFKKNRWWQILPSCQTCVGRQGWSVVLFCGAGALAGTCSLVCRLFWWGGTFRWCVTFSLFLFLRFSNFYWWNSVCVFSGFFFLCFLPWCFVVFFLVLGVWFLLLALFF